MVSPSQDTGKVTLGGASSCLHTLRSPRLVSLRTQAFRHVYTFATQASRGPTSFFSPLLISLLAHAGLPPPLHPGNSAALPRGH